MAPRAPGLAKALVGVQTDARQVGVAQVHDDVVPVEALTMRCMQRCRRTADEHGAAYERLHVSLGSEELGPIGEVIIAGHAMSVPEGRLDRQGHTTMSVAHWARGTTDRSAAGVPSSGYGSAPQGLLGFGDRSARLQASAPPSPDENLRPVRLIRIQVLGHAGGAECLEHDETRAARVLAETVVPLCQFGGGRHAHELAREERTRGELGTFGDRWASER